MIEDGPCCELFDLWTSDPEESTLAEVLKGTAHLIPALVFPGGSFCIKGRIVLDSIKPGRDPEEYWSEGPVPSPRATKISAFIPSQKASRWGERPSIDGSPKHVQEPQLPAIGRLEVYYSLDNELAPPLEHAQKLQKLATRLGRVIAQRRKVQDLKGELANTKVTERRLNESLRLAKLGQWDLDLVTNTLVWSPEIYKLFKINPKKFDASYEAFLNAIHPDDRDFVNEAYTNSLLTKQPYNVFHRLLFPDGSIKWVKEVCRTEFHQVTGKPLYSIGTVQDITDSHQERLNAPSTCEIRSYESHSDSRSYNSLDHSHENQDAKLEALPEPPFSRSSSSEGNAAGTSNHRQPKRCISPVPGPPVSIPEEDPGDSAPIPELTFTATLNTTNAPTTKRLSSASIHTVKTCSGTQLSSLRSISTSTSNTDS